MKICKHKAKYKHSQWFYYLRPKRLTLMSSPPIYKWLFWVISLDKKEYREFLHKRGQNTFIYCPKCDLELISSESWKSIKEDGTEVFKCKNCGFESIWNFDLPCPTLLEKGEEE